MAKALLVPYCDDIPGFKVGDEPLDLYLDGKPVATIYGVSQGDDKPPATISRYGKGEHGPWYSIVAFPDCMTKQTP